MSGSSRFGTVLEENFKAFDDSAPVDSVASPVRYSDNIRVGEEEIAIINIINEFDDVNVLAMPQGSIDGIWWTDLLAQDARFDFNAIPTMINKSHGALAVTDPWPFVRVKISTADETYDALMNPVYPTGGTVLVQWSSKRSRQNIV